MNSSSLAIEFLCPICHKLPLDHVVAEDGFIYCRQCIEEFMCDNKDTSPMLGTEMGKLLINSEVIAETIRDLIQCKDINTGLLPQSVVEERERFSHDSTDKEISNTKHEAQCDDMNNAYNGYCLITGKEGVERDWEEGFEILVEMASQKSNDRTRDFAAYTLGRCYEHGILGFKYNEKKSKKWYSLVETKPPNAYDLFVEFMIVAETIPETVEANVDETICSSLLPRSMNSCLVDERICKSCSKTIVNISGSSNLSTLCQSCKVIGSVKG